MNRNWYPAFRSWLQAYRGIYEETDADWLAGYKLAGVPRRVASSQARRRATHFNPGVWDCYRQPIQAVMGCGRPPAVMRILGVSAFTGSVNF